MIHVDKLNTHVRIEKSRYANLSRSPYPHETPHSHWHDSVDKKVDNMMSRAGMRNVQEHADLLESQDQSCASKNVIVKIRS